MVSFDHFKYELIDRFRHAVADGATTLVVTSEDLCRSFAIPGTSSQACCEAMAAEVKPGDVVLDQSAGTGMTVSYLLPRPGP